MQDKLSESKNASRRNKNCLQLDPTPCTSSIVLGNSNYFKTLNKRHEPAPRNDLKVLDV
jgi:hypothetical protein